MRAVAANDVHLVKPVALDCVADHLRIETAARAAQNGAAFVVDVFDRLLREPDHLEVSGVEPAKAEWHSPDVLDAVKPGEGHDNLADDGVEPRTEPAAGDDARAHLASRIEGKYAARAGAQELSGNGGVRRVRDDVVENGLCVADKGEAEVELRGVRGERGGKRADSGPVGDLRRFQDTRLLGEKHLGVLGVGRTADVVHVVGSDYLRNIRLALERVELDFVQRLRANFWGEMPRRA